MRKVFCSLFIFLLFSAPIYSQNSVRSWINSIDRACKAVENFNTSMSAPYLIDEYDNYYIVYDVYGADVRVNKDGSALISGKSSLEVVNAIYGRFFEELLYTYGKPISGGSASTDNGGRATAIFKSGSVQYELVLNVFASTLTLTRIPLISRIVDFTYEKKMTG